MSPELPFVERFERAIADYLVLHEARQRRDVRPETVRQAARGLPLDPSRLHEAFERLVDDGHLRRSGDGYAITDDGLEDVRRLAPLLAGMPGVPPAEGGAPDPRAPSGQIPPNRGPARQSGAEKEDLQTRPFEGP